MQAPPVQPFVSTIVNKLDAKARVSVPAPFRQILAQENLHGIYCFTSFASPALEAYGGSLMAEIQSRLGSVDALLSEAHDDLAQAILAETRLLDFDDEGRVRLPDEFIAHAGITERVTFVGMNKKFQIWDPERFEPVRLERIARARAMRMGKEHA
jgi:transcriptional regulator MraZ